VIDPVQAADLPELVELCALHAAYENAPYVADRQAERLAEALFHDTPSLFAWVARQPGVPGLAGYMTAVIEVATWPARPFVYMDCLYLREAARGHGLGRALVTTLSRFAAAQGLAQIQWQTPPDNALGIHFYAAIGATATTKLRFTLSVRALTEAMG